MQDGNHMAERSKWILLREPTRERDKRKNKMQGGNRLDPLEQDKKRRE